MKEKKNNSLGHLLILGAGLATTIVLNAKALQWIWLSWQSSPRLDGQGPIITLLGVIAWIKMRLVKEKKDPRFWTTGLVILGISLLGAILAEQVDINLLRAFTLLGSIIGIYTFVLGPRALTDLCPIWILFICAMPTVPYLFNKVMNPIFSQETNILFQFILRYLIHTLADKDRAAAWIELVQDGTDVGSPIFIFALSTFAATLCWGRFRFSFPLMSLFWMSIPLVRSLAVIILLLPSQVREASSFTSNLVVFSTATIFFTALAGGISWLKHTRTH